MRLMKRISILLALITLPLIASSIASAQDKGRGRGGFGGFGATNSVSVAANEAVQKELGLSADIVAKVTTLRDDYRAAVQKAYENAGISFRELQNITAEQRQKMQEITAKLNEEFDPKVKGLIAADPFKRLSQITLQANLRNLGPAALLPADVSTELGLNDAQRKTLTDLNTEFARKQRELFSGGGGGGGGEAFTKLREERTAKTMEVLNAEQKEKLKTLQGSPFDVSQLGFGGGRRGKGN